MAESNPMDMPQGLPTDVAALGEPNQIFAPGKDFQVNPMHLAATIGAGGAAILMLGVVAFFLRMAIDPIGENPPPKNMSLFFIVICTVMGFPCAWIAVRASKLAFGAAQRAYLLYDEVLVEMFDDTHRIIPWSSLGRFHRTHPFANDYKFAVVNDIPVHFDETMTNHAALVGAIIQATAVFRVTSALNAPTTFDSLRTMVPASYFLCRATVHSHSVLYRVSVVGNCLLFLNLGEGSAEAPNLKYRNSTVALGLAYKYHQRIDASLSVLSSADPYELTNVMSQYEGSFAVHSSEVSFVRGGSNGRLRLNLNVSDQGPTQFDLESAADARTAQAELEKFTK